jgi:hypothetical protein
MDLGKLPPSLQGHNNGLYHGLCGRPILDSDGLGANGCHSRTVIWRSKWSTRPNVHPSIAQKDGSVIASLKFNVQCSI